MSGGVIGTASVVVSVPAAVAGMAAYAVMDFAAKAGIAAYEQFSIAADYKEEIKEMVNNYNAVCCEYDRRCEKVALAIAEATSDEIDKLIFKLRSEGFSENELISDGSDEEKLLRLIKLELKHKLKKTDGIRSPEELFRSVTGIIKHCMTEIPSAVKEHTELACYQKQAEEIATDMTLLASEKSVKLKELESEVIGKLHCYEKLANCHRAWLSEFMTYKIAAQKIAGLLNERFDYPEYDPINAEKQLEEISVRVEILRDKLRKKAFADEDFIEANRILADKVLRSVEEAGYRKLGSESCDYGETASFEFGVSVLNVVVTKEGYVSMNIFGKQGETYEQIKNDEALFCSYGISSINRSFEKNGVRMRIDTLESLTEETVAYFETTEETEAGSGASTAQGAGVHTAYAGYGERTVI